MESKVFEGKGLRENDKIIQLVACPQQAPRMAILFALGQSGQVYVWDWMNSGWNGIEEVIPNDLQTDWEKE